MTRIIVGLMGSSVKSGSAKMAGADKLQPLLAVLKQHHVHELDTARVYNDGKSEEDFGSIPVESSSDFQVGTKAPGFSPGSLTYEKIIAACDASLDALRRKSIDLYYFHGPDRQTPLEESCRAIHTLHQQGKIQRFGVSNYRCDEVEEIARICDQNGWIRPSVYQGGYNPLSRTAESELFPSLRKLGIAFYAFSPLAGGYFSRPREELEQPPAGGRYDQMKFFKTMFVNDLSLQLHDQLSTLCANAGLSLKEATLRFLMHHSALGDDDGVILGGSSVEQMEENLTACASGPLPQTVIAGFEELWKQWSPTKPSYCV